MLGSLHSNYIWFLSQMLVILLYTCKDGIKFLLFLQYAECFRRIVNGKFIYR